MNKHDRHVAVKFVENGFYLLSSRDTKALINAIEKNHDHKAVRIIKRQPWYRDLAKK